MQFLKLHALNYLNVCGLSYKRSAVMLRKMMEESFASRRGGDHVDLEHDGNLLLKILLRNRPLVAIDEAWTCHAAEYTAHHVALWAAQASMTKGCDHFSLAGNQASSFLPA